MEKQLGYSSSGQNRRQPNIVFILIDDMGWRDLSCYGSTFYETPNIDRLAAEGMRFTDAYAACPVCSPTRASIMSGKYPATLGVTDWIDNIGSYHPCKGKLVDAPYRKELPLTEKCLAKALHEGGYQTWHIGKWHLGTQPYYPEQHGFDVNMGGCHWGHPPKGYFSPYGIETIPDGPQGEYLTDRLTDEAVKLIQTSDGRPFFLNLWHYAVHTPIQAKPEEVESFRRKALETGLYDIPAFSKGEFYPTEHMKHLRVTRRIVQSNPAYAAMIHNLDWNVGRLLDALDSSGYAENTIVLFTSDNGGLATADGSPTCNAPLGEGKGWMAEGGVREPLIVRWPGIVQSGEVCVEPVTSPDFFPTLLEAAGLPLLPLQHVDGESLLPLLKRKTAINGTAGFSGADSPNPDAALKRDAIFWHYPHYGNQGGTPGSAIRMGDWKLIEFFEDGRIELYNLREDIQEAKNLACAFPERASSMRKRLDDWRVGIEALIPGANPDCGANETGGSA